jgi:flagellar motor switch protein FliG
MSDDEKVKGAEVAAKILARMNPENRQRILEQLEQRTPERAQAVSEAIPRLERLVELPREGLQLLLKEAPHGDIVLSLKLVSEDLRYSILTNLSTRRRMQVEEDLAALPPVRKNDVYRAQERLLQRLEELRKVGKIGR